MMSSESSTNLNTIHNEDWDEARGLSCHHPQPAVACTMEGIKESKRTRKVGLANKGRVPWNKGKRHNPVHNPKRESVLHLRQVWAKRLKWKRSTEKFYSSWAESIAEAARRGEINEEELNWDSCQTLERRNSFTSTSTCCRKGQEKGDGKDSSANEQTERDVKWQNKGQKLKLHALRELNNRKGRLRKIHEKKVRDGTFCNQAGAMFYLQSALERLGIESIKEGTVAAHSFTCRSDSSC